MHCGIDWGRFFQQSWKKDVITLVCSYYQTDEYSNLFEIPLIINSGENSRNITNEMIEFLPTPNHEDVGTRFNFDATMSNVAAVIVAKDEDVILFLIYPLGQLDWFPQSLHMKIESNQYINFNIIYNSMEAETSNILPQLVVIPHHTN